MTRSEASSGDSSFARAYEQLRGGVLEDSTMGGHFGLAILLREGVAAWMAHGLTRSVTVARVTESDRTLAAPIISDDTRADMITVFASMVMATPRRDAHE